MTEPDPERWAKLKYPSRPVGEEKPDWNRILSALVALTWLVLAILGGGAEALTKQFFAMVPALACIWFPEALGNLGAWSTGPLSGYRSSPAAAVRICGWILLLSLTLVRVAAFAVLAP